MAKLWKVDFTKWKPFKITTNVWAGVFQTKIIWEEKKEKQVDVEAVLQHLSERVAGLDKSFDVLPTPDSRELICL